MSEKKVIVKKDWVANYNLVGEAKINEDYTYKIDERSEKSNWIYNSMNLGIDCGERYGVIYADMLGGYGEDRENKIFAHGKKDDGSDDFEKQIHTAAEQGIHGFKIICSHYDPHDTLPAVQVMAECQLPVLFHCGILYSKNCAAKYNRPIEFEELLAVKGLRFALAHAGWPWTDEFNAIVGEGRNGFFHSDIYVDITPGTPFVYRREVLKRLYMSGFDDLPNRVLWGTDGSTNNYPSQHVLLDIETDKKILSEIADPANVFDVPGYKVETYADIWKKVSEDNLNAFHKKAE